MKPEWSMYRRAAAGRVKSASHFLGGWRWAFMPLGLLALLAVGVHAAADTLDDRILWFVDRLDAGMDAFFGQFSLTARMVDWIGHSQRLLMARSLTLIWELAADA